MSFSNDNNNNTVKIISTIVITTITPSILNNAMRGLVSLVNSRGSEDNRLLEQ